MKKILKQFLFLFSFLAVLVLPCLVFAGNIFSGSSTNLGNFAGKAGYASSTDSTTMVTMISSLLNVFLGFLGLVFLGMIIWSGTRLIINKGDSAEITKSLKIILQATIGLIIIFGAYAITYFVFRAIPD